MFDRDLQHPAITAIERTGYPPQGHSAPVVCSECGEAITGPGFEGDGNVLCSGCQRLEFESLTELEQLEGMAEKCGRTMKYYG